MRWPSSPPTRRRRARSLQSGRVRALRAGRTISLTATLLCAAVLVPAGTAMAQSASRQTATVAFGQKRTGAPTAATVKIRYRDPENPDGKPFSVQRVVTTLAPGTKIDTSAPARCDASDAALMSEGIEACPPQSLVGSGRVSLDTGLEGSGRIVRAGLTLVNNTDELIMIAQIDDSQTRVVVRGRVSGNTIVSDIAPVPGGGPDGFTAIRDVDFRIARIFDRVEGELESYITTPPACTSGRTFANSFSFTYRDGVTQDVASPSACTPPDRRSPRIKLAGVPRRGCEEGTLRARIRVLDASRLRRVEVRLNGRRVLRAKAKRVVVRLQRDALRPGFNTLAVTAQDSAGNRARFARRFFRCD